MRFANPLALRNISCVKLTRTGIWLDWPLGAIGDAFGRISRIDLFEPLALGDFLNERHPYGRPFLVDLRVLIPAK